MKHLKMFSCHFDFTTLDNVHFQQAAQIAKALVENQIDFEAMVSTNEWMKVITFFIKGNVHPKLKIYTALAIQNVDEFGEM